MNEVQTFLESVETGETDAHLRPRLAASALLELSYAQDDVPAKLKRGIPVFEHRIPATEGRNGIGLLVRPLAADGSVDPASMFQMDSSGDTVYQFNGMGLADDTAPVSLEYPGHHGRYEIVNGRSVKVGSGFGTSSTTEVGRNTVRNAWLPNEPAIVEYVQSRAI